MKRGLSRRKFIAAAAASCVTPAVAHQLPRTGDVLALLGSAPDTSIGSPGAWREAGIADFSQSPFAKLKPVPVRAVTIEEGFWSKRRTTNVRSSIPTMHDQLIAHGRMDNFLRLVGKSSAPQIGPVYSDSDIYKWLEGAAFTLQSDENPELRATADAMIRDVVAVQEPSGYLNTYFVEDRKPLRMQYPTQTTGHELYNIGHMLQGAIAYYRATGDRTLLDAGMRFVDHFLIPGYGPGANQMGIVAGHPEIEMSLIEL
ncbi:MAG: beta-L-arabinofuranosidase domain-containing protein, partial [Terracidiphilus sp.]